MPRKSLKRLWAEADAAWHARPVEERLAELRAEIGAGALRSLQTTGLLHIWRRSSPHNWFIKTFIKTRRGNTVWHSDGRRYLSMRFFEKVNDSGHRIITGSWITGSDEGRPEESVYRLKDEYR